MSPTRKNNTDLESESQKTRRGRPAVAPEKLLNAADNLFSHTDTPNNVTMDAIAAAAGVGKGTLFRAFGNREGLLNALWADKLQVLYQAVDQPGSTIGSQLPPGQRAVAFIEALLHFKLQNRQLIKAKELTASDILQSDHYRWMHKVLKTLFLEACSGLSEQQANFRAHAQLATIHIDLIEQLLASGLSEKEIAQTYADHVRCLINAN